MKRPADIRVSAAIFRDVFSFVEPSPLQGNLDCSAGIQLERRASGEGINIIYRNPWITVIAHDRRGDLGGVDAMFVCRGDGETADAMDAFLKEASRVPVDQIKIHACEGVAAARYALSTTQGDGAKSVQIKTSISREAFITDYNYPQWWNDCVDFVSGYRLHENFALSADAVMHYTRIKGCGQPQTVLGLSDDDSAVVVLVPSRKADVIVITRPFARAEHPTWNPIPANKLKLVDCKRAMEPLEYQVKDVTGFRFGIRSGFIPRPQSQELSLR